VKTGFPKFAFTNSLLYRYAEESKKELDSLLSDDSLGSVPFLILGNKIDIPHASSEEELRHCLVGGCTSWVQLTHSLKLLAARSLKLVSRLGAIAPVCPSL
jgi:GTPase SAR1 family protein